MSQLTPQEQQTKQVITDFFAGLAKSQTTPGVELLKLLSDDVEWWVAGSTPLSGMATKADVAKQMDGAREISDHPIIVNLLSFLIDGNRAAVEAKSYQPLRDGRVYQNEYHYLIEVNDGKITKLKEYMDTAHVLDIFCR